jgi:hypothetical protein
MWGRPPRPSAGRSPAILVHARTSEAKEKQNGLHDRDSGKDPFSEPEKKLRENKTACTTVEELPFRAAVSPQEKSWSLSP